MLALGTWKLEKNEVIETVKAAVHMGYHHIDCASDHKVRKFQTNNDFGTIQPFPMIDQTRRALTSKLWCSDHSSEESEAAIKQTLSDLQLKYLDLYLIHWPISFEKDPNDDTIYAKRDANGRPLLAPIPLSDTWKRMEKFVSKGYAKNIGISNFDALLMMDLWNGAQIKPAINQMEIHPFNTRVALQEIAARHGVLLEAYSPLGSGSNEIFQANALKDLSKTYKRPIPQIVLHYLIQRGIPTVVKSGNAEHLRENLEVFDFQLTQDDINKINDLDCGKKYADPTHVFGINPFA